MRFLEPLPGRFTYAGWVVDPRAVGPVVRRSPRRTAFLRALRGPLGDLAGRPGVAGVRLLETTFVPPLPGRPAFDVLALVDGDADVADEVRGVVESRGLPAPDFEATLTNAARFGDTDAHPGPVLLNHFTGSADPGTAASVWRGISQWYESVLGVSNSTLLAFDPGAPYVIVNYAGVPGAVGPFLASQAARPSFYRHVLRPLSRAGLRPCPLFARRWSL